jgi:hypothetical protein
VQLWCPLPARENFRSPQLITVATLKSLCAGTSAHYSLKTSTHDLYGRGWGVGRARGVGVILGVAVTVALGLADGVDVGVAVAVGVGVGVGVAADCDNIYRRS